MQTLAKPTFARKLSLIGAAMPERIRHSHCSANGCPKLLRFTYQKDKVGSFGASNCAEKTRLQFAHVWDECHVRSTFTIGIGHQNIHIPKLQSLVSLRVCLCVCVQGTWTPFFPCHVPAQLVHFLSAIAEFLVSAMEMSPPRCFR